MHPSIFVGHCLHTKSAQTAPCVSLTTSLNMSSYNHKFVFILSKFPTQPLNHAICSCLYKFLFNLQYVAVIRKLEFVIIPLIRERYDVKTLEY